MVVIVNDAKVTDRLGSSFAVPVECIPDALAPVQRALARFGCDPVLRMAEKKAGPVVTDNGNLIVDMHFDDPTFDASELEARINRIPGVLENGIFTGVPRRVFVGSEDGMIEELRARTASTPASE